MSGAMRCSLCWHRAGDSHFCGISFIVLGSKPWRAGCYLACTVPDILYCIPVYRAGNNLVTHVVCYTKVSVVLPCRRQHCYS